MVYRFSAVKSKRVKVMEDMIPKNKSAANMMMVVLPPIPF